jgi:hypothetical protein
MRQVLCSLIAVLAAGCASAPFGRRVEPPVVIVRNLSGESLVGVGLRVPEKSAPDRIGYVSPVPRGTSQVFVRPASAPPLPNEVEVDWVNRQGQRHTRRVSLRQALREATGEITEALVFEIGPAGSIKVYCERSEPRR